MGSETVCVDGKGAESKHFLRAELCVRLKETDTACTDHSSAGDQSPLWEPMEEDTRSGPSCVDYEGQNSKNSRMSEE